MASEYKTTHLPPVEIDRLRLVAFASNDKKDREAYYKATSLYFQQRHERAMNRAADDRKAALQDIAEGLGRGVRVKPLEWEDHPVVDGPVMARAIALHGTYFIVDDTDDFTGLYLELISHDDARWWQNVRSTCNTIIEGYHEDDLTPLKAAAQADYEARILSTLEPLPSPDQYIRAALEAAAGKTALMPTNIPRDPRSAYHAALDAIENHIRAMCDNPDAMAAIRQKAEGGA